MYTQVFHSQCQNRMLYVRAITFPMASPNFFIFETASPDMFTWTFPLNLPLICILPFPCTPSFFPLNFLSPNYGQEYCNTCEQGNKKKIRFHFGYTLFFYRLLFLVEIIQLNYAIYCYSNGIKDWQYQTIMSEIVSI